MATSEPIEVTLAVTSVLERLEVEYVVGGSLATSLHGIPRATLDVDIVADLQHPPPGDHVQSRRVRHRSGRTAFD